ncbi:hypothetical protein [Maricaulis sp.]
MRWVGLIVSVAVLASAVWFAFAAPYQSGNQLVLAAAAISGPVSL